MPSPIAWLFLPHPCLRPGLGPHLLTHAQARSSEQRKQQMTCQCPGQLCAVQAFLKPEAEGWRLQSPQASGKKILMCLRITFIC